jgi:hypothetical protein
MKILFVVQNLLRKFKSFVFQPEIAPQKARTRERGGNNEVQRILYSLARNALRGDL